jgi:hypothetical protein
MADSLGRAVFVTCAVVLASACGKNEMKPEPAASASALAPSMATPGAKTVGFVIDPKSTTSIDMPAPKEHIKADTSAAAGSLQVDTTDLSRSRGEVKIDLSTLTTHTFDDADKNASQTTHARTWLEVVVQGNMQDANRYAVYAIRSIDKLSATDLTKVAPVRDGGDEVRKVTMTTHGELLIHGHKVDRDANVEVAFHYPPGSAPDARPSSLTIKTLDPLHIVLAEHDVKPRDSFGSLAQKSFSLLGTKVAETADVTFDVKAAPAS